MDDTDDKSISALRQDRDLGFSLCLCSEARKFGKKYAKSIIVELQKCFRHYPPPRHHHHEADALDVLAKTAGLYLVPELRYSCHRCRPCCCCRRSCCCPPPCLCPPPRHHHHEVVALDVLAKSPGLYLVPELRYFWFGMVWYGIIWFGLV